MKDQRPAMGWLVISLMAILLGSCGTPRKSGPESQESKTSVEVATPDTWALVDELGRTIPKDAPSASEREGKTIAMFYWTWHEGDLCSYKNIVNISDVIRNHPEALDREATGDVDPDWGQPLQPCFWGKPLFDYYRTTDPWVLRKHAEMLADAGVDVVFFDCTNGSFLWEESTETLMKVWSEARKDGVNAPCIAFHLPFGPIEDSRTSLRNLYAKIYGAGRYKDLWYRIDGKPVIMAYPDNLSDSDATDMAIREFFTFRPGQPDLSSGPTRDDQWGWLEAYPQHSYRNNEQMPVGIAQNTNKQQNKRCYAFNAPGTFGRSYTDANGQDESEMAYVKGLNFQEQWDRAFEFDPTIIWVTGWNEWTAGRQPNWPPWDPYKPFAFPDEFDSERSRDIEPTAEWGDYGDIYYCQLIENVRKFKGIGKTPAVTEMKTVTIGKFQGWDAVGPDFRHYQGNTMHRNHSRHGGGRDGSREKLVNTSGRNDFVDARVARDEDNIYFYIRTASDITPRTDHAWMRLLINIDRDYSTGWKGYDFCLNYKSPKSDSRGTVSRCTGNVWKWEDAGAFEYSVRGNEMELKVPRQVLGAAGALDFEFKWSDNMQEEGSILDFYVNGDCAPGGRFNFVYCDKAQLELPVVGAE